MSSLYLKVVGRIAAAIGELDRYTPEHLAWLKSGYVCQNCGTTLVTRGVAEVKCLDESGQPVSLMWARVKGKTFECPRCGHRWCFRADHAQPPTTLLGRVRRLCVATLVCVPILIVAFVSTYAVSNAERIFPDAQSVVIYGRDTCGLTMAMKSALAARGVNYLYANIDRPLVADEMWYHLRKLGPLDSDPHTAALPVVLVNDRVLERPSSHVVFEHFDTARSATAR